MNAATSTQFGSRGLTSPLFPREALPSGCRGPSSERTLGIDATHAHLGDRLCQEKQYLAKAGPSSWRSLSGGTTRKAEENGEGNGLRASRSCSFALERLAPHPAFNPSMEFEQNFRGDDEASLSPNPSPSPFAHERPGRSRGRRGEKRSPSSSTWFIGLSTVFIIFYVSVNLYGRAAIVPAKQSLLENRAWVRGVEALERERSGGESLTPKLVASSAGGSDSGMAYECVSFPDMALSVAVLFPDVQRFLPLRSPAIGWVGTNESPVADIGGRSRLEALRRETYSELQRKRPCNNTTWSLISFVDPNVLGRGPPLSEAPQPARGYEQIWINKIKLAALIEVLEAVPIASLASANAPIAGSFALLRTQSEDDVLPALGPQMRPKLSSFPISLHEPDRPPSPSSLPVSLPKLKWACEYMERVNERQIDRGRPLRPRAMIKPASHTSGDSKWDRLEDRSFRDRSDDGPLPKCPPGEELCSFVAAFGVPHNFEACSGVTIRGHS